MVKPARFNEKHFPERNKTGELMGSSNLQIITQDLCKEKNHQHNIKLTKQKRNIDMWWVKIIGKLKKKIEQESRYSSLILKGGERKGICHELMSKNKRKKIFFLFFILYCVLKPKYNLT